MNTTLPSAPPTLQHATLLQQIARVYQEMLPAFEQYVGMSLARWRILAQLRSQESMSQAALQQRIQVDPAAITRQVKQLEEQGLVARRPDPHDNRFTLVSLTEAGRQYAEQVYGKCDAFEALATAGLSEEEITMLRHCLAHMHANLLALGATPSQR